jgi:hypothetical protein
MDWERRGPLVIGIAALLVGVMVGFFVGKSSTPALISVPKELAKPLNLNEVPECKDKQGNALDACLYYEAAKKRNMQYCIWIGDADFRNLCVGALTHDARVCNKIFSNFYKRQCMDVVEGRIHPEYVVLLEVVGRKDSVPEPCKTLTGPQYDLCIIDEAKKTKNHYLCGNIVDNDTAYHCMAVASGNENFCELIGESNLKRVCKGSFQTIG